MMVGAGLLAITPVAMASADDNLITKENVIEHGECSRGRANPERDDGDRGRGKARRAS